VAFAEQVREILETVRGLAILPRFQWYPVRKVDEKIAPGEKLELYDQAKNGYIYWCFWETDNPDAIFCVDLQADTVLEIKVSPRWLYERGFTEARGFKVLR